MIKKLRSTNQLYDKKVEIYINLNRLVNIHMQAPKAAQAAQAPQELPNDPKLNTLVGLALMGVHAILSTGVPPPVEVMAQVDTGLNQYVRTLSHDSLAHPIVHSMRHLFTQMAAIQGTTPAARRAFLDPALQSFILALRVIPCVGEFLATLLP